MAFERGSVPCCLERGYGDLLLNKRKAQQAQKFKEGIFLGIKDGCEEAVTGTPSACCY